MFEKINSNSVQFTLKSHLLLVTPLKPDSESGNFDPDVVKQQTQAQAFEFNSLAL